MAKEYYEIFTPKERAEKRKQKVRAIMEKEHLIPARKHRFTRQREGIRRFRERAARLNEKFQGASREARRISYMAGKGARRLQSDAAKAKRELGTETMGNFNLDFPNLNVNVGNTLGNERQTRRNRKKKRSGLSLEFDTGGMV